MIAFVASMFVFLAIVAVAAVLWGPARRRTPAEARIRALRPSSGDANAPPAGSDLRRYSSSIPTLRRLLTNWPWASAQELQLQRANLQLRVGEFLLMRTLLGFVSFLVIMFIFRFQTLGFVFGPIAGVAGFWLPSLYVNWRVGGRRKMIERQLVDMVPMLSSSLRAGFAMQQAIEVASRQIEPPLSEELTRLLNDVNLGATMQSALLDWGRRVGSVDLDILITAILVQRTTGGNLSEILDKTAESMAERERIRGDVHTLTSAQRLTGLILSVYPILVGLILLAMMPHLWSKLFTESAGRVLLGIALGLQVIGFYFMRRVLDVEV